jgi:hypothetical protein
MDVDDDNDNDNNNNNNDNNNNNNNNNNKANKIKAISVTGRGSPQNCETSRLPYFLDNRLTDGGEVASLTRRPPFSPQENLWYSFLIKAESTPRPQWGWKD